MTKSNAGFLALVAVAVAAAIGAFFVSPKLFRANVDTASQSAPPSGTAGDTAAPEPAQADAAPAPESAGAEPAGDQAWIVPSFDVLRVEPDGSTVIAGKAEPGTTLDIMNGEQVLSSTQVGPSGDFAAVLDVPLAAGDYQLNLRIRDGEGGSRLSEEVATVSIPKDPGGDLLAMVTKPGKASRIIAQPAAEGDQPAAAAADTAQSGDAATASDAKEETASAAPAQTPDQSVAPDVAGSETAAADPAPAAEAPARQSDGTDAAAPVGTETPALQDASTVLAAPDSPVDAGEGTHETADAPAQEPQGADPAAAEVATAMAAPQAGEPEARPQPDKTVLPAGATVRVDAVEIEGGRMFVAGSAPPGFSVRVSADGIAIGTEKADETGRFIVEAMTALSVGDHTISADLMDGAGEQVLLRATVPFQRPEGEALAAVAPSVPVVADPAAQAAPVVADMAELSRLREESFDALSRLSELLSQSGQAADAAFSSAYDDAVAKLRAAASARLPEDAGAEAMAMAQAMRAQAQASLEAILPPAQADGQPAPAAEQAASDPAGLRERVVRAETALSEPSEMAVVASGAPVPTPRPDDGAGPRTIVQAPLAKAPGAVIIRRGDTLWQISRRTYGQGVRYTTIYVANRSQIQNPDRIKPGQVFSVPESPLDNAEEMHRQLLGGSKTR
ncbi:LysM peptidoglycan-binding domain-containing protein [Hoeflea olei]|uniref:LysM domain-containing protein n=1 Tax=Hoeflea olei TaxID=1480615 RepID=A0A1C1YW07_9HYPH|nr:LysM peptidoglycan-binding domain-containing protein [Hoeflea olei]OCW57734.1 hypothetical protein AWJ14_02710 [Hoeflea olei]